MDTLARAGVDSLYEFAGRSAVDLLSRIESRALNAHSLARIIVDRAGAERALADARLR
jgi:hypothetical protein